MRSSQREKCTQAARGSCPLRPPRFTPLMATAPALVSLPPRSPALQHGEASPPRHRSPCGGRPPRHPPAPCAQPRGRPGCREWTHASSGGSAAVHMPRSQQLNSNVLCPCKRAVYPMRVSARKSLACGRCPAAPRGCPPPRPACQPAAQTRPCWVSAPRWRNLEGSAGGVGEQAAQQPGMVGRSMHDPPLQELTTTTNNQHLPATSEGSWLTSHSPSASTTMGRLRRRTSRMTCGCFKGKWVGQVGAGGLAACGAYCRS